MNIDWNSKPFFKIFIILVIAMLTSSVIIGIVAWNFGFFESKNKKIESENSFTDLIGPQKSLEIDTSNEESTNPNEIPVSQEPMDPLEPSKTTPHEEPEGPIDLESNEPILSEQSDEPKKTEQSQDPNQIPNQLGLSHVRIDNQDYYFDPKTVNTVRPDLFKQNHFSMFDILVHLEETNEIKLDYHFDETLNTHIIDAINGEPGWWYIAYYSGGWPENNVFRPDHYPWKPGTQLIFYKESYTKIVEIYETWQQELIQKETNNGTIIIPEVLIHGNSFTKEFKDVQVTAHNLRNDIFQENIITAIDVIISLADQGKITYELQWYDYIGTAGVVQSYWVESINEDKAQGTCGFVYEAGSKTYKLGKGNHIHLPSDTRIINSPEYVEFFWICLDPIPLDNPSFPSPNQ